EDRRRSPRRVLQGGGPPRAAVRQGRQTDRQPAPGGRPDRAVRPGRDRLMTGASVDGRAPHPRWQRVVLKVRGGALALPAGFGLDADVLDQLASEIVDVRRDLDVDVAIVVGGGNFWRGLPAATSSGMDRAQADHIGMIATVMNALALQDA